MWSKSTKKAVCRSFFIVQKNLCLKNSREHCKAIKRFLRVDVAFESVIITFNFGCFESAAVSEIYLNFFLQHHDDDDDVWIGWRRARIAHRRSRLRLMKRFLICRYRLCVVWRWQGIKNKLGVYNRFHLHLPRSSLGSAFWFNFSHSLESPLCGYCYWSAYRDGAL